MIIRQDWNTLFSDPDWIKTIDGAEILALLLQDGILENAVQFVKNYLAVETV